jgi:transposase
MLTVSDHHQQTKEPVPMLTREDDVDAHALHARGWSISAIARHLGHDRKTIRAYVSGGRVAGQRARSTVDPFDRFAGYVTERLREDPHLWATTLFDELVELGFNASYQTLTRQIRVRELRPVCDACRSVSQRPTAVIEHRPGEETQWDWLELPDPPASWGCGSRAHLLIGALAHSGRWRARLAETEQQPQLIDGLDRIARTLGGLTGAWRFDRMATVCHPDSGRVTASFAAVAKHYGVSVAICPPRAGNRKGVVEKAAHSAAQRWWRTLGDDVTIEAAQASLDRLCERLDQRKRVIDGQRDTVAGHAGRERLRAMPAVPFPATVVVERKVAGNARVAWRGNLYSVPPELARSTVTVTWRLGASTIDIATPTGAVIARHRVAPDGAGVIVADHGHVAALNTTALAAVAGSGGRPHRRKERIPPGPDARAQAARIRGDTTPTADGTVVDLARYAQAAHERNTLT